MKELITDFTLKSYITRIIRDRCNLRDIDITAIDRNVVIDRLWHWISLGHKEETEMYKKAFEEQMPKIHSYIDDVISDVARENMVCSITAATAKGMIEQIITEEGLDVPKICSIRGTEKGRVILYFEELDEKINCPLDYLRARLIRRFANKRRK
jgi:hypothetical protein